MYYPPEELLNMIGYARGTSKSFVRGEGCRECHDTGFRGRTGIYEVFTVDDTVRRLMSRGADSSTLHDHFRDNGGRTLLDEGIRKVEEHQTSLDEAMRVAFFD
jgi:type II secretory ATPase GspE/PulE/Tfp pilus assembly ATPase PilB-like protein